MNILKKCPPYIFNFGKFYYFLLYLAYVSSFLEKEWYDINSLNSNHCCNNFEKELKGKLKIIRPDLFLPGELPVRLSKIAELVSKVNNQNIKFKVLQ